jgi:hypothetical protein
VWSGAEILVKGPSDGTQLARMETDKSYGCWNILLELMMEVQFEGTDDRTFLSHAGNMA